MNTLKRSTGARFILIIFSLALSALTLISIAGAVLLYGFEAYSNVDSILECDYLDYLARNEAESTAFELGEIVISGGEQTQKLADEYLAKRFDPDVSNLRLEVLAADGSTLCTNGIDSNDIYIGEYIFDGYPEDYGTQLTLRCYLDRQLQVRDNFRVAGEAFDLLYSLRYELVIAAGFGIPLSLLLLVLTLSAAGYRPGSEGVVETFWTRIPVEIMALVLGFAIVMPVYIAFDNRRLVYPVDWLLSLVACLLSLTAVHVALINLAHRLKTPRWWRRSLIYLVIRLVKRAVLALWHFLGRCLALLASGPRAAVVAVGCFIAVFALASIATHGGPALAWLLLIALFAALPLGACYLAKGLSRLCDASGRLAAGDLAAKVELKGLEGDMAHIGQNLNSLGDGMAAAVEERLRSERFRTELITNVSHDLKTPLTSIISYTDLLSAEPLEPKAAGYVEVLERQSARLKKLTDDLIEASKASSGSVAVDPRPTDLAELVCQAVGEYSERLEQSELTPVVTAEGPIWALADGRLVWRVVDNLLSNACKYSQRGTRLYISVALRDGLPTAEFKNTSREQLNMPAEELMERFVRGDSSRTGEGSGLGLSIARGLVEAQGGRFDLAIEADLFKATLVLPVGEPPAEPCEKDEKSI